MSLHIEVTASLGKQGKQKVPLVEYESLAAWLHRIMEQAGLQTAPLIVRPWGIEFSVHAQGCQYYLGVAPGQKRYHWHVFLDKRRSIVERLLGYSLRIEDTMACLLKDLVSHDSGLRIVAMDEQE